MKILILGGNGMLGSTVDDYLSDHGYDVQRNSAYWPSNEFKEQLDN